MVWHKVRVSESQKHTLTQKFTEYPLPGKESVTLYMLTFRALIFKTDHSALCILVLVTNFVSFSKLNSDEPSLMASAPTSLL